LKAIRNAVGIPKAKPSAKARIETWALLVNRKVAKIDKPPPSPPLTNIFCSAAVLAIGPRIAASSGDRITLNQAGSEATRR
jgi:hypothetical protein